MPSQTPSIAELAAQLQKALDSALGRNEQLIRRIAEAEKRAEQAETRAVAAQEKLKALEALKTKEYQTVVTELFEEPSRRAAWLTVAVAAFSILVGLAQTIWSNHNSSQTRAETDAQLAQTLESRVVPQIKDRESRLSRELREGEERMKQTLRASLREASAPPLWSVQEVPANGSIQRTLAPGQSLYFRISAPESAQRLEVRLIPTVGDADLYFRFGELPLPQQTPGAALCRSARRGLNVDTCHGQGRISGDWYVRVDGVARPYTTFVLEALVNNSAQKSSQ